MAVFIIDIIIELIISLPIMFSFFSAIENYKRINELEKKVNQIINDKRKGNE